MKSYSVNMGSYPREYTGCIAPMIVYKYQHFVTMNINMMKANTDLILTNFSNLKVHADLHKCVSIANQRYFFFYWLLQPTCGF